MSIISKKTYLISRWIDPIFAISIGCFSYFLYEKNHPRPEYYSLKELLQRKKDKLFFVDDKFL
ncbi:hypothetical protein PCANB_001441 [Pneumocystis canis]|nr:hypothetical protein PCANB_001441 [Pneumocystis canis]